MTVYYKATRPNGTDFFSGEVDYAAHWSVGVPLKPKPSVNMYRCCTNTVYHAADTPGETLVGGSWPCRLFEVTGTPVAQMDHIFGFRSFRVVREIEPWRVFGPNGQDVAVIIDRCGAFLAWEDEDDLSAKFGARIDARIKARHDTYAVARAAARDTAREAARAAAREACYNARAFGCIIAAEAASDAAIALVVRDLISKEHFDALYERWDSVMGAKT